MVDTKQFFIRQCDNLDLLKKLKSETLDLIYCDILYGTGRKFEHYQDIKAVRSEIENFYIPRIKEMYRVLKSTGSIYLQMDNKISHWMRCILDDIFGYKFVDRKPRELAPWMNGNKVTVKINKIFQTKTSFQMTLF